MKRIFNRLSGFPSQAHISAIPGTYFPLKPFSNKKQIPSFTLCFLFHKQDNAGAKWHTAWVGWESRDAGRQYLEQHVRSWAVLGDLLQA